MPIPVHGIHDGEYGEIPHRLIQLGGMPRQRVYTAEDYGQRAVARGPENLRIEEVAQTYKGTSERSHHPQLVEQIPHGEAVAAGVEYERDDYADGGAVACQPHETEPPRAVAAFVYRQHYAPRMRQIEVRLVEETVTQTRPDKCANEDIYQQ